MMARVAAATPGEGLPKTPPMVCSAEWISVNTEAMRRNNTGFIEVSFL